MNKKVRQLSTDNKMASVHQQDDDPEKIIDLGTRIPVLRTPIASDVLIEAALSPEQWRIHEQQLGYRPSTSEAYLAIAEYLRHTSVLLP